MRTPDRDRRGHAVPARCLAALIGLIALLLLAAGQPAGAAAVFTIAENGTSYTATIDLNQTDTYPFMETGVLGEQIPATVTNVNLYNDSGNVTYQKDQTGITFQKGNYTISYQGTLRDDHILLALPEVTSADVHLPTGLDVRNPLIGQYSPGGKVSVDDQGQVSIHWDRTSYVEVRYYDQTRESLLYMFANIWVVVAIVLLTPYLLMRRRKL
ncbi:DUF5803 family protein [Methanosphaerula palustris]|nr:DUF5803 family protein [Methanosphaerula palustris]